MNALLTIIVTTCDSLFFCVCKDRLRYYRSRWRFPAWRLCFLSLSVCLCLCVSCSKVMRSFTQQSSCVLLRRHLFFIIVRGGMCLFSFCVYLPRFFFFLVVSSLRPLWRGAVSRFFLPSCHLFLFFFFYCLVLHSRKALNTTKTKSQTYRLLSTGGTGSLMVGRVLPET